jgi:hypothetical protein
MIRPELAAFARRYSEVLTGLGISALGLWALQARGGFYQALALLVIFVGLVLALIGWRRLRFDRAGDAPGIVQILEGQISYFGPETGGFIGVADILELHLINQARTWRLIGDHGNHVEIPVSADGARALFDIFATLPEMNMPTVLTALDTPQHDHCLWLHPARRKSMRSLA